MRQVAGGSPPVETICWPWEALSRYYRRPDSVQDIIHTCWSPYYTYPIDVILTPPFGYRRPSVGLILLPLLYEEVHFESHFGGNGKSTLGDTLNHAIAAASIVKRRYGGTTAHERTKYHEGNNGDLRVGSNISHKPRR